MKLRGQTVGRLLALYAETVKELRRRNVVSSNNVVGGYGETLLAQALNLDLMNKKGYDAKDGGGRRYQIKSRWLLGREKQARPVQASGTNFDFMAVVLFNDNLDVHKACLMPVKVWKGLRRRQGNSYRLTMSDNVWDENGVEDISREAKRASARIAEQR